MMENDPNHNQLLKIEFDVNLTCNSCADSVRNSLSRLKEIKSINIDVPNQHIVVETFLPSRIIKEAIESTGKKAVLKGFGSSKGLTSSAVAEIKTISGIFGVIRFHQIDQNLCIIDGTVDGLEPGEHGLHIYEFGDLSQNCERLGSHFNPTGSNHGGPNERERHYGDLGNIKASDDGRATFRIEDSVVKVDEIIGRSIAITERHDDLGKGNNEFSKIDGNSGKCIAWAIIARSAGLFENPKRFCQCDGISIWDETKMNSK